MTTAAPVLTEGDARTIRTAVSALRDGGVIALPTDTVYGIVGLYDSPEAVDRIFEIKGRPETKPLPLLLGTTTELPLVADRVPENIWPLIYRFWPGPLTIILRANASVSARVTAGTGTVGTRVPNHPAVLEVLEAAGFPLASSSANLSGEPPATTHEEVLARMGHLVDLIVAPRDPTLGGRASTVVDLVAQPYTVRRRGDITPTQIRDAVSARVEIAPGA